MNTLLNAEHEVVWSNRDLRKNKKANDRYLKRLKREMLKSEERQRELQLDAVRNENRKEISERRKKLTTTKILMYFIMINLLCVEIYSMAIMYIMSDLSSLYVLITAVIGESISYAIYCLKSFNDTKEETKSQLERDRFNAEYQVSLSDEEAQSIQNTTEDPIPTNDDHSGDIPEGVTEDDVIDPEN